MFQGTFPTPKAFAGRALRSSAGHRPAGLSPERSSQAIGSRVYTTKTDCYLLLLNIYIYKYILFVTCIDMICLIWVATRCIRFSVLVNCDMIECSRVL